ncbi:unnamed protein product [Phaedon cochleariae]|uniref:BED-type domain-containing protein n=1 Tax=Phaedon cochleariae TaxID=80249 RepID=A0A9N9SKX2_PHACE|nr:unnamed protein product [Phaedon cochleariae]
MSSKRKHSSSWAHFTEDTSERKRAKCKYCSTFISIAGGSFGNLNRHMKTKHPLIPLTIERQSPVDVPDSNSPQSNRISKSPSEASLPAALPQSSITQYIRKPPPIRRVEKIDRQVVKMVAKGHHALRIVDEIEMRTLIEMVSHCPGYQLPSRKTLSTNLMVNIYNEVMLDVKKKIQDAPALSLTTDGWTSSNNESYIAVTAHFIDADTKLCSALLTCIAYNERHTSQNLCKFLKDVMVEWNISHKVAAVVSDNAANIINAVRIGEWRSVGCFAHLLNLVVQDAIKDISDVLSQVKSVVEYFNRSTQGLKKLTATQQQMSLPVLKLKQDVPTRWNSTYDMLERIVQVKDAVIATVALLRSDLSIKEDSWEIIEGVLPLLKPFYEVTVEISAEKNITLSKVIVLNNLIQSFLQKHSSQNDKVVSVQSALKRGMENRFKDLENNVLYAECTVLDPRFKQKGFRNQRAYDSIIHGLRNKIGRVQLPQREDHQASTSTTAQDPTSSNSADTTEKIKFSIWEEYDDDIKKTIRPDNKTAAGIRELDKYLNEEYLDRKKDPLQWWQERRHIYPHLYAYVLKRFCIVATSVPCERVFSATGQIIRQRRTLLKPNKVSKLIFLHHNM